MSNYDSYTDFNISITYFIDLAVGVNIFEEHLVTPLAPKVCFHFNYELKVKRPYNRAKIMKNVIFMEQLIFYFLVI